MSKSKVVAMVALVIGVLFFVSYQGQKESNDRIQRNVDGLTTSYNRLVPSLNLIDPKNPVETHDYSSIDRSDEESPWFWGIICIIVGIAIWGCSGTVLGAKVAELFSPADKNKK